jgi:hypothetical protein
VFAVTFQLCPVVLKHADIAASGRFTGIAASFSGQPDRHGDVLQPGLFERTLRDWERRGARIPLLFNHDRNDPIGSLREAQETSEGLAVEGELALEANPTAQKTYSLLRAGGLALSIGATVPSGGAVLRSDGVRVLRQVDLIEVSAVSVPADPGAVIRVVKSLDSPAEWQDVLRQAGLSKRQSERFIHGGLRAALKLPDNEDDGDVLSSLTRLNKLLRGN